MSITGLCPLRRDGVNTSIPALTTGAIALGTLACALLTGVVVATLAMGSSVARALRSE